MHHHRETLGIVKNDPEWKKLKRTLSDPRVSPGEQSRLLYQFLKSKNFTGEALEEVRKYLYYLKNHKKYQNRPKFHKKGELDIDI